MDYTVEEAALIDGVIGSAFSGRHLSGELLSAYQRVHQHLVDGTTDADDWARIESALEFIMPETCATCNMEDQRSMVLALAKTRQLIKSGKA